METVKIPTWIANQQTEIKRTNQFGIEYAEIVAQLGQFLSRRFFRYNWQAAWHRIVIQLSVCVSDIKKRRKKFYFKFTVRYCAPISDDYFLWNKN